MTSRRSSVVRKVPPEVRDEFNRLIVGGQHSWDELVEWLNDRGFDISRSAAHRYGQGHLKRMEGIELRAGQASAIVAKFDNSLDMHDAAGRVAMDIIFESLLTLDKPGMKPEKLMTILAKLQQSQATLERERRRKGELIDKAEQRIKARLSSELENHPDLAARLVEIVGEISTDLRKEAA